MKSIETIFLPNQGEDEKLLWIVGKIHCEVGQEQSCQGVGLLEPHGEQAEESRATNGSEEASPVISHGEVRRGYFNAEKYAADGRCKT